MAHMAHREYVGAISRKLGKLEEEMVGGGGRLLGVGLSSLTRKLQLCYTKHLQLR